jgi:rubrerythrin
VKASALVEANSADYVRYLHNVFANDPDFSQAASYWGVEERQHGDALGRWAETVDPTFIFEQRLARFRAGYQIPLEAARSVRGSQAGELVARCVVESGTCSFYSAIRDTCEEPVLRQIAGFIAQDEARHYRLFKTHLSRYLANRKMGLWERCKITYGRVAEADDDELAFAYYSANTRGAAGAPAYNRKTCAREYSRQTLRLYEFRHLRAAAHMILRAADLNPASRLSRFGIWLGWRWLVARRHLQRRLSAAF